MAILIDSYSESNQSSVIVVSAGEFSAVGQSFTGDGNVLDSAKFYLSKNGTPTGNAYVKIYAETHSTAFGTDSLPTGAVLATSDAFDVSTLTSSLQLSTFTFSGAEKIRLTNGVKYVVVFEYTAGNPYADNISVGEDGSSPTHSGNMSYYGGSWSYDTGIDVCFYVYGETTPIVGEKYPLPPFRRSV